MKANRLGYTFCIIGEIGLKRQCARGHDGPHAAFRHPIGHPFRHGQPNTTRIQNSVGIHPRRDEQSRHFRRRTDERTPVWSEAFRTIKKRLDPHIRKRRHTFEHDLQLRLCVIHIKGQLIKFKGLRNTVLGPCFAARLKPADQQFSGVFFPISALFEDVEDR